MRRGGVAVADQPGQRGQQLGARREHPDQGALGEGESVVGQRGDDAVRGTAQYELLAQQLVEGGTAATGLEPASH
ncbi:MAG TPA: hypothetical protein VJT72_05530 [Pseudonocardiaceae bacterium]|nr:hypothetical protein [Pseudonocardiaceae bacterium]